MKKIIGLICGFVITLMIVSCASTKQDTGFLVDEPIDFTRTGGKTLDSYWDAYFKTKDTAYIDKVLSYANEEDLLEKLINENYDEVLADIEISEFLLENLELIDSGSDVYSTLDLEFVTAALLKSNEYTDEIKALWAMFEPEVTVRIAVKSSAYWSVISLSEHNKDIKKHVISKFPELSEKTRTTLSEFLKD